jgi:tetratricopeptide (TPR) repeat protein
MTRPGKRKHRPAEEGPGAAATAAPAFWLRHVSLTAGLVALVVYLPSLAGGFLYDDGELILRNPSIRDLGAIGTVLRYEPARPLLNLTWALNYALGGEAPWHYHLVNVLVHAANAALLASLFLWMAERWGRAHARAEALLGACLFAASPMAAETVAYVASRSSALVTLFTLASLRLSASVLSGASPRRLVGSMALFLLALATKEEAAALPLLLLLLDYFFVAGQRLSELRRRASIHAAFLAVIPLGLAARRLATGSWLPAPAMDTGLYLLTQWAAFPLYLFRALVPLDPALYRNHPPASWPPDATTAVLALLTAVVAILAVARRRQWPAWSFAVGCLAAGLLPSSSIVPLQEMVVDHRAYLGSLGVTFALGLLLHRVGGLRLGALVVVVLAGRSVAFERVLSDPVRAWEHAVARAPDAADALAALAEAYSERGDPRAEGILLELTQVAPANYRYWANLGLYWAENGRREEAVGALRSALERNPREASVRDFLGQVLASLGRDDEAAAEFEATLAAEPTFGPAYAHLAALALRKGDPERARKLVEAGSRFAGSAEEAEAFARVRAQLP